MDATFIDNVIRGNLLQLKTCLDKLGELGCFYSSDAHDGKMEVWYYITCKFMSVLINGKTQSCMWKIIF